VEFHCWWTSEPPPHPIQIWTYISYRCIPLASNFWTTLLFQLNISKHPETSIKLMKNSWYFKSSNTSSHVPKSYSCRTWEGKKKKLRVQKTENFYRNSVLGCRWDEKSEETKTCKRNATEVSQRIASSATHCYNPRHWNHLANCRIATK
jgi:hypothetical protein